MHRLVPNMNLTTTINKTLNGQFKATDLDGDKQTFNIVKTTSHGTLKINEHQFTYTPTKNFNGTDSFNYQSNDGKIDSNIAKITIIVSKNVIKVINTPETPIETPTSIPTITYQTTAETAKYTPADTLNLLPEAKTSIKPDETQYQNTDNITPPQVPGMFTSLQNTPLQFLIPTMQKVANYLTSIFKF